MACRFTRFAFCGYEDMFWSSDRQEGFQSCLADHGFETFVFKPGKRPARELERSLAQWIEQLPKPIGMMAPVDERSQEIIELCTKLDIDVPGQMGIVGVDNDPLICELSSRPLSSVNVSVERGGYEAAERLADMISGRRMSRQPVVMHPTHVTQRISTDSINVEDPALAEAISYIMEHAREPVSVENVVQQVGMSRRSLERRFKSELGRSIYHEIRRVRVACIERYLVDTHLGISEIAREMKFLRVEHFARYFRAERGESPVGFRKRMVSRS
jgi:LacI family transcriptional regulator